jgi:regulator of CtrA degradation
MQLASWLLLHRSLADGEISAEELNRQRAKIRMVPSDVSGAEETRDQMPVKMRELIQLSFRLQSRIMHLDSVMDQQPEKRSSAGRNAVALQQMLLSSAFESTKNS